MTTPTRRPAPFRAIRKAAGSRLLLAALGLSTLTLLGFSIAIAPAPTRGIGDGLEPAERAGDVDRRGDAPHSLLRPFLERHARATPALERADPNTAARIDAAVDSFYQTRSDQGAWLSDREARRRARALLTEIGDADAHGLRAADYQAAALRDRLETRRPSRGPVVEEMLQLELDLSRTLALYASDLAQGRVDPSRLDLESGLKPRRIDLATVLQELATGERDGFESLAPRRSEYRRLTAALARYRELAARGGWPTLPEGELPRRGERGDVAVLHALARRLEAEGDLAAEDARALEAEWRHQRTAPSSPRLEAALRRFQLRHGLDADGVLGQSTRAALDTPVVQRIQQIVLNLERLRWLPDPADRRITVNVPAFELTAFDRGRPVLAMRVAAGKPSWSTPSFVGDLSYLVVNPSWNVPEEIAESEVIPNALRNRAYLDEEGLELIDEETGDAVDPDRLDLRALDHDRYRFRQPAGTANPLGRVKFMFPNDFDVYLHDTPDHSVFERADRAVSHGCIRLAEPLRLADLVLAQAASGWSPRKLRDQIRSGEQVTIRLDAEIPVEIVYLTASVDDEGRLRFFRDAYGRDELLARALHGRGAAARTGDPPRAAEPAAHR